MDLGLPIRGNRRNAAKLCFQGPWALSPQAAATEELQKYDDSGGSRALGHQAAATEEMQESDDSGGSWALGHKPRQQKKLQQGDDCIKQCPHSGGGGEGEGGEEGAPVGSSAETYGPHM